MYGFIFRLNIARAAVHRFPQSDVFGILEDKLRVDSRCSSTTHLSQWLSSTFKSVRFTFHDFSASGRSTKGSVGVFSKLLFNSQANLTSNDIIFIDHSVNDAQDVPNALEANIERLVRTMLVTSATHYKSRPTIIVIEQYAHKTNNYQIRHELPRPAEDTGDYAHIYRKVSKHYELVLWSMREVFWTYFGPPENRNFSDPSPPQLRLYPFSPFLRSVHGRAHVPYFIHTFIADIMANIIEHTMKQLEAEEGGGINSKDATFTKHPHSIRFLPPSENITLPAPLNNLNSGVLACDVFVPYLLDAEANSTFQPVNVTAFEGDAAGARQGWREYIDYHERAGWMVNILSDVKKRELSFPLQPAKSYVGLLMNIVYLRSYEGMGQVRIYLCDRLLRWPETGADGVLDSLRPRGDHVSIPYAVQRILTSRDDATCQAVSKRKRTVRVSYLPGVTHAQLRAIHLSKFKLMDVEVCSPFIL